MQVLDILNGFDELGEDWEIGRSNYWILVNKDELNTLKEKVDLDEESSYICKNGKYNSSKIIFFDSYMFLSFNIIEYKNQVINNKELNIYLSKDYIITVYNDDISIIRELIQDIKDLKNCFMLKKNPKPDMILYYIIDRIIVKDYSIMASIEERADEIEISILKNPSHKHADDLIHLRRQLYKVRKYLNPLRYIGDSLISNDNLIIEDEDIAHFENINNKTNKLMCNLESLVQDLALVREAFESEIANKTNDLMKVFTVITSIFLPLNLITSMKGMNFESMPLISAPHGYYCMVLIMIIITIILLFIFKKKRWL